MLEGRSSTSTPNPADPPAFSLTLSPAAASVLQGGTTSYGIEAANGPARLGAARLSVDGLPSGVTALFIPAQIAPGQAAQMLLRATSGAAVGAKAFTVRAVGDGGQGSSVAGTVMVLAGGRTALAGRVVDTNRQPLSRVAIILDNVTVSTDANGNFLMLDPPVGEQVVLIDGDPAGSPANRYPTIPVSMTLVANQLNELPYLPHLHRQHERFTPIHPTQKTVATDPDLPGVALHLEGGNDVIGWDGKRADKVSIRTVPVDRLPVRPLPPGLRATKVYMFYFGKRGGGIPQQPVPFEAPNELGLAPGDKAELWYFDESPRKGEAPNDWRKAGLGTVSADGRTITTDAGVGIPKFCCGAVLWNPQETGAGQQPGPTSQAGNEVPGADPVDLATGIFTLRKTDLVLPGRIPVAITRSYRSGDTFPSAFGVGTRMSYDEFLQQPSSTVITYVYGAGARTTFIQQADGSFTNGAVPAFRGVTLRMNADGTRTLRYKDGRTVTFDSSGLQIARKDAAGNQVTILRTVETNPTTIQEPSGRALTVSWIIATRDRLSQVSDPLGRTVQYGYDASNRLVTVTDPAGGVTQYGYDSASRMTTVTDTRGIVFLTNVYDSNSRVCRQTQADGGVYAMYYVTTDIATAPASVQLLNEAAAGGPISQAPCTPMGSTSPVVATVLVDPRGHPTTYRFNGGGVLTSVTDALGQVTTYEREANTNLLLSVTDALSRVTRFTYDAQGNVLTVTDAANNIRTLTYDPTFNAVTTVRDPLNQTTTFAYDAAGNLTGVTDPLNDTTMVTHNAFGQPLTVKDPLNNTTTFTYDTNGNLATVLDPLGNTTTRSYDTVSRLTGQTDPLGAATTIAYDVLNRVTSIRDAKGGTTSFAYDLNDNLLSLADARGSTTSYTYNSTDRVATRTDPLGHSESFAYDLGGNLSQHTDRKGQVATFSYDPLNRRTGAIYADATVGYTLDVVGRVTQATDSIGGTIINAYDTLDRLSSQTTALGTVSYQYDALGRRTQMTVPNQNPVTYAYDAAFRLTSITQGPSLVQFAYDIANRRTSLTLPNGVSTQSSYDAASHLTALTYELGSTTLGDLQYLYDAAGNRIQVGGSWARTGIPQAVPSATYNVNNQQLTFGSQSLAYDLNGNLTSDGTNTYTWDARNRLVAITGPVSASFLYDAVGRRSRKTINSVATDFVYDALNPVQEQSGSTITNLLTGLDVDEYFSRGDATSSAFFLSDVLGSTIALADNSGGVATAYVYEAFGAATTTGAPTANPYDFTGRESDLSELKYYRARYYSPSSQRFVAEDPLECERRRGMNLYAYVRNSPINLTDPLGLAPVGPEGCSYYDAGCASSPKSQDRDGYLCRAGDCCRQFGNSKEANGVRGCLIEWDRSCATLPEPNRRNCRLIAHAECYGRYRFIPDATFALIYYCGKTALGF
jgi:RHS repeat-associated protein